MTAKRTIRSTAALAGSVVLALSLPACAFPPWLSNRGFGAGYDVQRPTYGPDTGKPFFVSGYAGANYEPLFPRRRVLNQEQAAPVASEPALSVEHGAWDPE